MSILEMVFGERIANGLSSIVDSYISGSKSIDVKVICPYCQKVQMIGGPGEWECFCCHEIFDYKMEQYDISKEDNSICYLFGMFAKILKVKGTITTKQMEILEQIIKENLALSKRNETMAKNYFRYAKKAENNFEFYGMKFYSSMCNNEYSRDVFVETLEYFYILTNIDSSMSEEQLRLITFAGSIFRIDLGTMNALKDKYNISNEDNALCYLFGMFAKIAKAEGVITKEQIKILETIMYEELKLNKDAVTIAKNAFKQAKGQLITFETYCLAFYECMRKTQDAREVFIQIINYLFMIATINNELNDEQSHLVTFASSIMRIDTKSMEYFKSKYESNNLDRYYTILECSKLDSLSIIKSKYRKLVSEYHPDKLAHKNLPKYLREYTEQKFREVQEAYEQIIKYREC